MAKIGQCETLGPILMGMSRPVHVLHRGAQVEQIVDVAAIAVVDAQENESYLLQRQAEERAEPVTVED